MVKKRGGSEGGKEGGKWIAPVATYMSLLALPGSNASTLSHVTIPTDMSVDSDKALGHRYPGLLGDLPQKCIQLAREDMALR